jgi:hypothetical protein
MATGFGTSLNGLRVVMIGDCLVVRGRPVCLNHFFQRTLGNLLNKTERECLLARA